MTRTERWKLLFAAAVVTGAIVAGSFAWRAYQGGQSRDQIGQGQQTLCQVLRKLVTDSDSSLDSFAYYRHHPAELASVHEQNKRTLRLLDCDHLAG